MQLGEHSGNRFKLVLRPVDSTNNSSVNGSSKSSSNSSSNSSSARGSCKLQHSSVQAAVAELSRTGNYILDNTQLIETHAQSNFSCFCSIGS
jgi:hypothetical protein